MWMNETKEQGNTDYIKGEQNKGVFHLKKGKSRKFKNT